MGYDFDDDYDEEKIEQEFDDDEFDKYEKEDEEETANDDGTVLGDNESAIQSKTKTDVHEENR